MKRGILGTMALLAMLVATLAASAQSIGGVLSGSDQNDASSLHSITASDMNSLCAKKNEDAVKTQLLKMGWNYRGTEHGSALSVMTWALDLNYYNTDRAMAWMYVYLSSKGVERVIYSFSSEKFIRTFEQTIGRAGFRPFDYSDYDEDHDIISGYQNTDRMLFLRYDDGYDIECVNKRGQYDPQNGEKRMSLDEGGYAVYTLVDGKINGLVRLYDDDGTLAKEFTVKDDNRNGASKEYHADGKTVAGTGQYVDGKEHGTFKYYTLGGKLYGEETYDHGTIIAYKLYEGDGNLVEEKRFNTESKTLTWEQMKYEYDGDSTGRLVEKEITDFTGKQPIYKKYRYKGNKAMLVESIVKDGTVMIADRYPIRLNDPYLWIVDEDGQVLPHSLFAEEGRTDMRIAADISIAFPGSVCLMTLRDGVLDGSFRCYVDTALYRRIYVDSTLEPAYDLLPSTNDTSRLRLAITGHYSGNVMDGIWRHYDPPTGKLFWVSGREDDRYHGVSHYYSDSTSEEFHYNMGALDGGYTYTDKNGLKVTGIIRNSRMDSVWTWSTSHSREKYSTTYSDGEVVEYALVGANGKQRYTVEQKGDKADGWSSLYDTAGNRCFHIFCRNNKRQSLVDERYPQGLTIHYSDLFLDTIAVCFEAGTQRTEIRYVGRQRRSIRASSTLDHAVAVDSLWLGGTLRPVSLTHTVGKDITARGTISNGQKTGVWEYYFPSQFVALEVDYRFGTERYKDYVGNPYTGTFEWTDATADVREVRKIRNGELKDVKRTHLSTGKKYKEEYRCDYYPIRRGKHNYLFPNVPVMDSLAQANTAGYGRLSENWTHLMDAWHHAINWVPNYGAAPALGKTVTETLSDAVETGPSFPGGQVALEQYLASNIQYPSLARENGISGRVVVKFVVEPDGTITGATVIADIGGGCGKEALRVVNAMPRWTPGTKNGKPVRTECRLPVVFKLK